MLVEASTRVRVPVIQKRTDCKIKKQKVYEALFMGKRLRVYTLHNSKKAVTAD